MVVFHEVNLEEHVLGVADELLANLRRLLVRLKLRVLLARVQALLVRVNLGLDLARCDQLRKF